jgi:hypothetical protein
MLRVLEFCEVLKVRNSLKKPKDKGPAGPRSGDELRKRLLAEYTISSAPALALVDAAASALDVALAAEKLLERDGLCIGGQRGLRAHPAAAVARDARARLLAALRQLGVELS